MLAVLRRRRSSTRPSCRPHKYRFCHTESRRASAPARAMRPRRGARPPQNGSRIVAFGENDVERGSTPGADIRRGWRASVASGHARQNHVDRFSSFAVATVEWQCERCPRRSGTIACQPAQRVSNPAARLERLRRAPRDRPRCGPTTFITSPDDARARIELRTHAPPVRDVADRRDPDRGVGQRGVARRRRATAPAPASPAPASDSSARSGRRARARARTRRERSPRARPDVGVVSRRGGEVVAAHAADEHQRVASDAKQLRRGGARVVRAEQIVALRGEPGAHRRRVELLFGRTQPVRLAARRSRRRSCCVVARRARCSLLGKTAEQAMVLAVRADLAGFARDGATNARSAAAKLRRQIERRPHAGRAQRVGGEARVRESGLDILRDRRRGAFARSATARPSPSGSCAAHATELRTSRRAIARSHGASTTSDSSNPQYTTRRPPIIACVSAASSSGSRCAGCGWSE